METQAKWHTHVVFSSPSRRHYDPNDSAVESTTGRGLVGPWPMNRRWEEDARIKFEI